MVNIDENHEFSIDRFLNLYGFKIYFLLFFVNLFWNGFSQISDFTVDLGSLMAKNPFVYQREGNYQQEAPLFYLLAHGVGATTPARYLRFCCAAVACVHLLFLGLSVRA